MGGGGFAEVLGIGGAGDGGGLTMQATPTAGEHAGKRDRTGCGEGWNSKAHDARYHPTAY